MRFNLFGSETAQAWACKASVTVPAAVAAAFPAVSVVLVVVVIIINVVDEDSRNSDQRSCSQGGLLAL